MRIIASGPVAQTLQRAENPVKATSIASARCVSRNLSRFLTIRDQLGVDPDDIFVNPYLNKVLFG